MTKFSRDQVIEALDAIIADKPGDYTYADRMVELGFTFDCDEDVCRYSVNGEPACIVGQVFFNLTGSLIKDGGGFAWNMSYKPENQHYFLEFDNFANRVLTVAQKWQDRGWPWSVSVEKAKESRYGDDIPYVPMYGGKVE